MEQILDDISDNLVCCLYAQCSSDNLYNCVVNIYFTCHARNVETGITSFTVMFVFACKSYKFFAPNYFNLTNNLILTSNNHTKLHLTCDK